MNSVDPKERTCRISLPWILLIVSTVLFFLVIPLTGNVLGGQHEVQVEFSFDIEAAPGKQIAGYYLYMEGQEVCSTGPVDPQHIVCMITAEDGTHQFTLAARYDDNSLSPQSAPFPFTITTDSLPDDLIPPTPPGSLSTSTTPNIFFLLQWTTSTDNVGVTNYQIYRDSNLIDTVDTTSFGDTGLEPGTSYLYEIYAVDLAGNLSSPASLTVITPDSSYSTVLRLNAGGDAYTDASGNEWSADYSYNTGNTSYIGGSINGTADDSLYAAQRWDPSSIPELSYSFALTHGQYLVRLHFAETYSGTQGNGLRVFDILIEDQIVYDDLDIYSLVGANTALQLEFPATVLDGQLNIEFLHGTENPTISAIEVFQVGQTDPPPDPVVASVSADSLEGRAPFTVSFNASGSTGPIASYTWSFGDDATGSGDTANHTYLTSGAYTATLTVTRQDGTTDQASVAITVLDPLPLPEATISITPSSSGQAPFAVQFDGGTSSGTINSYSWTFGDGNDAGGPTATHTYETAGTYTATLTVEGAGTTSVANVDIVVTPPPVEPTAVISSSTAGGEAPLTVTFSGADSQTQQPPIVACNWSYDDGASGAGENVEHTFTSPGTYNVHLTVTDDAGLTDDATIPVIVSAPPEEENQLPVASFTISEPSGSGPYVVSFDGSSSDDPDGTIVAYSWTFDDEATSDQTTVERSSAETGEYTATEEHSFAEAGEYTVSLVVTDDSGDTAVSTQTFAITAEEETPLDFEISEIQVDSAWTTVTFAKPFNDPVVIVGPPSFADAEEATVRIRNLNQNGFDIHIQEWDYLDGSHSMETVSYMAMEKGTYTLENGVKFEAGTFEASSSFSAVAMKQPYDVTPVILTQVATNADDSAVIGRIRNVTQHSFEYKLQEQETTSKSHQPETVGYIAWEPGIGSLGDLQYEVGTTGKRVKHQWYTSAFQSTMPDTPLFIADMQTTTGGNTASLRTLEVTQTSVSIKVEEEQSKDSEIRHTKENVGFLAIGAAAPSGQ